MRKSLRTILALCAVALGVTTQAQTTVGFTDATSLLTNASLDNSGEGWTLSATGGNASWETHDEINCAEFYAGWGSLALTEYSIKQTVTLPAGSYKISVYAFYRYGLYWNTDASKSLAYVYAKDASENEVTNPVVTLGGAESHVKSYANSMSDAAAEFAAGNYKSTAMFELEEEQEVELGLKGTHELKQSWFILGPFTLEKFNWTISTDEEWASYFEENSPSGNMNSDVKTALTDAETTFKGAPTFSNYNAYLAAVETAKASVKAYATLADAISTYGEKAAAISESTKTAFDAAIADIQTAYDNGTYTDEEAVAAVETVKNAVTSSISAGADITSLLVNPGFDIDQTTGWTRTASSTNGAWVNNSSLGTGAETWCASANQLNFDNYQVVTGLPAGVYCITAQLSNAANSESAEANVNGAAGLYAQSGDNISFAGVTANATEDNANNRTKYTVYITVTEGQSLQFGVKNEYVMDARWFSFDDFTLTYLGSSEEATLDASASQLETFASIIESLPMDDTYKVGNESEDRTAALTAISAFLADPTLANYKAAQSALQTFFASYTSYQTQAVTIDESEAYTPATIIGSNVTLKRTVKGDDTWNTFCVPFAISNYELKAAFGNDVAVAEFTSFDATTGMEYTTMGEPSVSPNVPVLLKGTTESSEFTFARRYVRKSESPVVTKDEVSFVGIYAPVDAIYSADEDRYVISGNKVHPTSSETATALKGTRAYIAAPTGTEVKIRIDGEDATAISGLNSDAKSFVTGAIYTLSGQRVNSVVKGGLYIVNGKKVMVK